jgi:hypothetical protein
MLQLVVKSELLTRSPAVASKDDARKTQLKTMPDNTNPFTNHLLYYARLFKYPDPI